MRAPQDLRGTKNTYLDMERIGILRSKTSLMNQSNATWAFSKSITLLCRKNQHIYCSFPSLTVLWRPLNADVVLNADW